MNSQGFDEISEGGRTFLQKRGILWANFMILRTKKSGFKKMICPRIFVPRS